jgi:hypothetical protein
VLCQLSYAPGLVARGLYRRSRLRSRAPGRWGHYPEPVQRRALGLLFATLAAVLAAVGVGALVGAGGGAGRWLVAAAALAIAAWLASLAAGGLRRR